MVRRYSAYPRPHRWSRSRCHQIHHILPTPPHEPDKYSGGGGQLVGVIYRELDPRVVDRRVLAEWHRQAKLTVMTAKQTSYRAAKEQRAGVSNGAAKESNLPTRGLHVPAGLKWGRLSAAQTTSSGHLTGRWFASLISELPSSGHGSGHAMACRASRAESGFYVGRSTRERASVVGVSPESRTHSRVRCAWSE